MRGRVTEALHGTGSEFSFVSRELDIPREKQLWESSLGGGSNHVSSSRNSNSFIKPVIELPFTLPETGPI